MEIWDKKVYNGMIKEIFDSVGRTVGTSVMLIVTEHALWSTKNQFDEASLIRISEEGASLEGLSTLEPAKAQAITHEFVMAIIRTLGRLVGAQIAQQLTLQLKSVQEQEVFK